MNRTKEGYKKTIAIYIADCYAELDMDIAASQGCMPEHELNQLTSTLKYLKNLIKTIVADDEDVELYISEAQLRLRENDQDRLHEPVDCDHLHIRGTKGPFGAFLKNKYECNKFNMQMEDTSRCLHCAYNNND